MPMHMLWRWDAGVKWIDIRHKVTGERPLCQRHCAMTTFDSVHEPGSCPTRLEAYFNSGSRSVTESCCG